MKYVCVIGGANIDISGTSHTPLKLKDSNPAYSTVSLGGVSRNIAENLARLGIKVVLITAVGNDAYGKMIQDNAHSLGIDMSHSLVVNNVHTSNYICINDSNGDMFVAVADMDILDALTPQYLATKLDIINNACCVVTDANIPHCLQFIFDNVTVPIFFDTVSAKKTQTIKADLHNIFALKPNIYEAEILSGIKITNQTELDKAMQIIAQNIGVKWLCVSNGEKGVTFCTPDGTEHCEAYKVPVINTTGAGDSFMAGMVYGYVNGKNAHQCVQLGCAASAVTIQSHSTVSSQMSADNIMSIIKKEN